MKFAYLNLHFEKIVIAKNLRIGHITFHQTELYFCAWGEELWDGIGIKQFTWLVVLWPAKCTVYMCTQGLVVMWPCGVIGLVVLWPVKCTVYTFHVYSRSGCHVIVWSDWTGCSVTCKVYTFHVYYRYGCHVTEWRDWTGFSVTCKVYSEHVYYRSGCSVTCKVYTFHVYYRSGWHVTESGSLDGMFCDLYNVQCTCVL